MEIKSTEIKQILEKAGDILTHYFGTGYVVAKKGNRDILHKADLESEKYILHALYTLYPKITVLSEETGISINRSLYRFVLDPLDGTINFSRGIPEFGISLALQKENKTIYGVVYKPYEKQWYEGFLGKGSFQNGIKLRVSSTSKLEDAVIAIDPAREDQTFPKYTNLFHTRIRAYRSFGCAVQTLGLIAQGKIDAYLFDQPKIWDFAAMHLIIEEAGGIVTNHQGESWKESQPIMVSNRFLHKELLSLL